MLLGSMLQLVCSTVLHLHRYYAALAYFTLYRGKLDVCPHFSNDRAAQIHIFSIAATLQLLKTKHYRAPSLLHDIQANLSNVSIPGTGLSASIFFANQFTAWAFFLVIYPAVCLAASLREAYQAGTSSLVPPAFKRYLLDSQSTWFGIWRLNCIVVAFHEAVTDCHQYALEDKGTFLLQGQQRGIPVTPFMETQGIVVKHKHIEGGMGLHIYRSFTEGGDWIIQAKLSNSEFVASLLPADAPLSTFRVITASRHWLQQQQLLSPKSQLRRSSQEATSTAASTRHSHGPGLHSSPRSRSVDAPDPAACQVLTVVFRAGRAGASTDHNSVCFDVDVATGVLGPGRTNQHWYRIGAQHVGRIDPAATKVWTKHPDCGAQVTGV